MAKSKEIIRPENLQSGDLLGVVAPAGPVDPEALEKGLKVAILSMMIPDTLKMFLEGTENLATRVVSKKL